MHFFSAVRADNWMRKKKFDPLCRPVPHACFDGSISNKEVVNHGTQAFCCTSLQCSKVSGILRDFLAVKGESVSSFFAYQI